MKQSVNYITQLKLKQ